MAFPNHLVDDLLRQALQEDLGLAGDITTEAIIAPDAEMSARLVLREEGVVAGLPLVEAAFLRLDPACRVVSHCQDGAALKPGTVLAEISGNARAILMAERVALNLIQRLSGVATKTRAFVDAVAGTQARIACTRKTTPGLRAFEKYAVAMGGGVNHRFGLFDAILIKDNHIAAVGDIGTAIEKARAHVGHLVKIEVEVDTLDQLDEALKHAIDVVLLDNMSVPELREAVARVRLAHPHVLCEASGGVRLLTVRAIAETGVNMISVGALTHSAPSLDIGLDF